MIYRASPQRYRAAVASLEKTYRANPRRYRAVTAPLLCQSQTSEPDGNEVVTVMVRCWSATGELDVRFALDDDQVPSSEDVRWKFDKGPMKSARWRLNPRGDAMVVPQALANEIVRDMRNGKTLELLLPANRERSYHVSLAGSSRAIGEMQKLCAR